MKEFGKAESCSRIRQKWEASSGKDDAQKTLMED